MSQLDVDVFLRKWQKDDGIRCRVVGLMMLV
jgi:hypothetical protein